MSSNHYDTIIIGAGRNDLTPLRGASPSPSPREALPKGAGRRERTTQK